MTNYSKPNLEYRFVEVCLLAILLKEKDFSQSRFVFQESGNVFQQLVTAFIKAAIIIYQTLFLISFFFGKCNRFQNMESEKYVLFIVALSFDISI